jgi:DNA helicase-2/ATP-dependent DNA helicase PcrA
MAFVVTPEHQAFFDWIADPNPQHRAAILEAVAGSGKTTTLREAAERITTAIAQGRGCSPDQVAGPEILYLAFNKSAVEDVKARGLPQSVRALTLNSLGHRSLTNAMGRITLDTRKTRSMLIRVLDLEHLDDRQLGQRREFTSMFTTVNRLVSKAKAIGLVPRGIDGAKALVEDTPDAWDQMIDHFDIDAPQDDPRRMGEAIDLARRVLVAGLRDMSVIDYDDQLYATIALGVPLPRFAWVMADEAQDISAIQREMLRGSLSEGGRLVAVGDPHQAIYGFRGADSESLAQIAQTFGARRFPLSCTYRCPRLVVELAQVFVPHLRARDGAPDGTIQNGVTLSKIGEAPGAQPAISWRPDDLVVCRNTAPLIAIAYQLIRAKTPCHVLGREIGTGLISLVKKLKPRDLEDFGDNLDRYQRRETDRLKRTGSDDKIEALDDKCETLRVFIDEAQSLGDMETTIRSLFDDDERQGRTTLSTIHRAKGSEAPRVIIVDPWRMPSRMASQPWQLEQERNLAYVAVTRAKESLVFANLGPSNNPAAMPPPQAFGLVSARAEVRGGVVVRMSDRRPA